MGRRDNPFDELERLFDRMSRQFEGTTEWSDEDAWQAGGSDFAIDLVDEDDAFVVTVDVPGFDRNELDVRIDDQTLRIEAERREETDEREEDYVRHERRHESRSRAVRFPTAIDPESISATLRNGVLTVTVPKAQPAERARAVEIEDA
jgi:HSP20 family protein